MRQRSEVIKDADKGFALSLELSAEAMPKAS